MTTRLALAFMGAAIFLTTACGDQPKLWKRNEIEGIAEDIAEASTNSAAIRAGNQTPADTGLDARVRALEVEVHKLKVVLDETNRAYDLHLKISHQTQRRSDENDRTLTHAVNILGRYHGIGPLQTVPDSPVQ